MKTIPFEYVYIGNVKKKDIPFYKKVFSHFSFETLTFGKEAFNINGKLLRGYLPMFISGHEYNKYCDFRRELNDDNSKTNEEFYKFIKLL